MASVFCTKCGQQLPDNASVCPSCGHARTGITTPPASPPPQRFVPANVPVGRKTPGFFRILLDTSFNDFITLKLIKFFYILGCIVFAIVAFIVVPIAILEYSQGFQGLQLSNAERIGAVVIASPVSFIVGVVLLRVYLELVASVFRIAENTTVMAADLNEQ
jgi:Domain of unknown function (DUF4282)/zinc-ribbon domain